MGAFLIANLRMDYAAFGLTDVDLKYAEEWLQKFGKLFLKSLKSGKWNKFGIICHPTIGRSAFEDAPPGEFLSLQDCVPRPDRLQDYKARWVDLVR